MDEIEIDRLHGDFRRALGQFRTANSALNDVSKRIDTVAKAVHGRNNLGTGDVLPAFKPGVSDWPDNLPTKKELIEGLTVWANSRDAVSDAIARLPEGDRAHLPALPSALHKTY